MARPRAMVAAWARISFGSMVAPSLVGGPVDGSPDRATPDGTRACRQSPALPDGSSRELRLPRTRLVRSDADPGEGERAGPDVEGGGADRAPVRSQRGLGHHGS